MDIQKECTSVLLNPRYRGIRLASEIVALSISKGGIPDLESFQLNNITQAPVGNVEYFHRIRSDRLDCTDFTSREGVKPSLSEDTKTMPRSSPGEHLQDYSLFGQTMHGAIVTKYLHDSDGNAIPCLPDL
jgi:hypothetical protein